MSPECPECDYEVTARDPDAMTGHLMDHGWDFGTANEYMKAEWPPMEEWPDE